MGREPYLTLTRDPYWVKSDVEGRVVAVLDLVTSGRNLELITARSRVVKSGDIHELVLTGQYDAAPGTIVNDAVYLAFVEIISGGVLQSGDQVLWGDTRLGTLAGFDETHFPNHYNLVIKAEGPRTGRDAGVRLGDRVTFRQREAK